MKTSPAGLIAIEKREGERNFVYKDAAGLNTIGVGHCLTREEWISGNIQINGIPVAWHLGLTHEQIDALLVRDITRSEGAVSHVTVPLSQNQYDCLVSFVFNVGGGNFLSSTLLKKLESGEYAAVPHELQKWIHSGGKVDPILIKRRESEILQWNEG